MEPVVIDAEAAMIMWQAHGQELMERVQKYFRTPGWEDSARTLEVSLMRMGRAAREVIDSRRGITEGGTAAVPESAGGSESSVPPRTPGESRVSTTEVAKMLHIKERQVRNLIRDKRLLWPAPERRSTRLVRRGEVRSIKMGDRE